MFTVCTNNSVGPYKVNCSARLNVGNWNFHTFLFIKTNMRSVSFVEHLKLKVDGKILHQCIALGDVDGDEANELMVADANGKLSVYKGILLKPWQEIKNLGDVSCIGVGKILNNEKDLVIVLTAGGICTILDLGKSFTDGCSQLVLSEQLVPNVDSMLIADVDADGQYELITSHTDQHVSAFRWNDRLKKFMLLQRWKLQHLAGNVTLHYNGNERLPTLIVSQPGCSYAVLNIGWGLPSNDSLKNICTTESQVEYTPLSRQRRSQNPAISCQIIGNICKSNKCEEGYFALCTLDGTIKLMEQDHILWSLQVDHQLFTLKKMDVLGDNREEVIVCARDGQTYIVDHDKNVVRYHFEDEVQAFYAGNYSIDGKTNCPCLVYADFHKQIWVYYDVRLPFLRAPSLLGLAKHDKAFNSMFKTLEIKTDTVS